MAENIIYLNDDNFEQATAEGLTLVDFYADWCGPCRMMEPVFDELSKETGDKAKIAKLDIESAQKTASNFNVTSIPTMILFKNGEEVQRMVGVKDKETLKGVIESYL